MWYGFRALDIPDTALTPDGESLTAHVREIVLLFVELGAVVIVSTAALAVALA